MNRFTPKRNETQRDTIPSRHRPGREYLPACRPGPTTAHAFPRRRQSGLARWRRECVMVFTRPSAAGAGHNQEYWDAQRRRRRRKNDAERKRAKAEQQIDQHRADTTRRYGFSPTQATLFFFLEHYPKTQSTPPPLPPAHRTNSPPSPP